MNIETVKAYLLALQNQLCESIQAYEPNQRFVNDPWQREQGGGGITRVLQQGEVFDSAGANFSHVMGAQLPPAATKVRAELANRSFEAMGVSSVIHPKNPFVPTCHMNVRLFVAYHPTQAPIWWFGGGFDLTPYYPQLDDTVNWHKVAERACQPFGEQVYPHYKAWADEYFYLPHRQETRGIGGLFFDDLNAQAWGWDFEKCFAFMRAVGDNFWQAYGPLLRKHHQKPWQQQHRNFQLYRRGRYVEFNLVYDRGTLFGLQSGGRTESILMSLPPVVNFAYHWQPIPGSLEAQLYDFYLKPQDWLSLDKKIQFID